MENITRSDEQRLLKTKFFRASVYKNFLSPEEEEEKERGNIKILNKNSFRRGRNF
jgi:hypothetical protein